MKKILALVAVVIVAWIAWYLLSPLWRVVEVDEASPLDQAMTSSQANDAMDGTDSMHMDKDPETGMMIEDAVDTMSEEQMEEFTMETKAMEDEVMVKEEVMPPAPRILAQAPFKPRAHEVAGKTVLIEAAGKKILRFEDFDTINGPDLRIYLSADLGTDDFVDLGAIRATKGNVNYELDASIDTGKYKNVLVWCEDFSILFSYATLE